MKKIASLLTVVLFLGACSSLPQVDTQKDIENVMNGIMNNDLDLLVSNSSIPFLMDREFLVQKNEVKFFWESLVKTDIFEGHKIEDFKSLSSEDFSLYFDALEVSLFFQKYLLERTFLANITCPKGKFRLLLGYDNKGKPQIQGLRGPDHE